MALCFGEMIFHTYISIYLNYEWYFLPDCFPVAQVCYFYTELFYSIIIGIKKEFSFWLEHKKIQRNFLYLGGAGLQTTTSLNFNLFDKINYMKYIFMTTLLGFFTPSRPSIIFHYFRIEL